MTEINFKELWQGQKTQLANPAEIIQKARRLQRITRRKIILSNLLLLFTMCYIIAIVICFKPEMLTTKIGALLVVVGIVIQIVASGKMMPLLKQQPLETSNAEYLQKLLLIKKKQAFLQSRVMALYFVLLGLGLMLYLYEYTLRMSLFGMCLTYSLTIGWLVFGWIYLRKRAIRKETNRMNAVIAELKNIETQFAEKE
jgi:uncharacterized membrane protein (DUF485 family)